jgi:Glycosyl hydrolase family 26
MRTSFGSHTPWRTTAMISATISVAMIISCLLSLDCHAMSMVIRKDGGYAHSLYHGRQTNAQNSPNGRDIRGGSIWMAAASSLSPDGSVLTAGSSGSLTTTNGVWTFSPSSGAGGFFILLSGQSAGGGSANSLYVENGGQVYALNSSNNWYLWTGSSWIQVNDPSTLNSGVTPANNSMQTYQAETGRNANLVNVTEPWGSTTGVIPFDWPVGSSSACCIGPWASSVAASAPNTVPMITWEPMEAGGFSSAFCPASIAAGASDSFITEFASEVAGWGAAQVAAGQSPLVFLRLMHEMNVSGWQWSVDDSTSPCGYTTAAQFIAAWQHIYNIFQAQGATNAKFVWCTNNNSNFAWMDAYPGDAYVDYAAIDGYNWGSENGSWQTFNQVYSATYAAITAVTSKPIIIAEWGSVEAGSGDPPGVSKAAWITDAFNQLLSGNYSQIQYEVWYDQDIPGDPDWQIDTSAASEAAFAAAVAQINQ